MRGKKKHAGLEGDRRRRGSWQKMGATLLCKIKRRKMEGTRQQIQIRSTRCLGGCTIAGEHGKYGPMEGERTGASRGHMEYAGMTGSLDQEAAEVRNDGVRNTRSTPVRRSSVLASILSYSRLFLPWLSFSLPNLSPFVAKEPGRSYRA